MAYPFRLNTRGRTAVATRNDHVRHMIRQVLFTGPGERVNRPDFGCGLTRLLFGAADGAQAATVSVTVQGALQRWLGDLIEVQDVIVTPSDSQLTVEVVYLRLDSGETRTDIFAAP